MSDAFLSLIPHQSDDPLIFNPRLNKFSSILILILTLNPYSIYIYILQPSNPPLPLPLSLLLNKLPLYPHERSCITEDHPFIHPHTLDK